MQKSIHACWQKSNEILGKTCNMRMKMTPVRLQQHVHSLFKQKGDIITKKIAY